MTMVPFLLTIELDGGPESTRLAQRLQATARKFGFRPTWLVGPEALKHPAVLEPLVEWSRAGEIEVGALLVVETVPPLVARGEESSDKPLYLTGLPESVIGEKIQWITHNLVEAFEKKPVTLRVIRPAVDERLYTLAAQAGYKVDMTVVPHAKTPGSDFTSYSSKPYLTPQGVLEIPRTVKRRKYHPFIEDLMLLPSLAGRWVRWFFPILRGFRLNKGNRRVVMALVQEFLKNPPTHLDLRISAPDWKRGDRVVRDLERVLATMQTLVQPMTAEEFLQRYKTEQLRKGLV